MERGGTFCLNLTPSCGAGSSSPYGSRPFPLLVRQPDGKGGSSSCITPKLRALSKDDRIVEPFEGGVTVSHFYVSERTPVRF